MSKSEHSMRVLIVNTNERKGGAAVAANRLMSALNNNGAKATMMVMEKQSSSLHVVSHGGAFSNMVHFLWERVVIWAANLFSRRNLFKVSIANTGTDITNTREFLEADVIHLHWVNQGFLSLNTIGKILRSGKPVVWTMHDMWPLTAICHHAGTCRQYATACHHCPLLRFPRQHDLSARVFRRKRRLLEDSKVHFVAVSEWLAEKARQSALTGTFPVSVIPNVISLSRFILIDRLDARSALQLREPYVIVFGAARIDDDAKGFCYLTAALQQLVDSGRLQAADLRLLLFGGIKDERVLQSLPVPYTYLGYINDDRQLSEVYSASNAVVSSSPYETFGQTIIEAQACGCVPVAFGGSGQTDIISHLENGYLAEWLSVDSLADGILWALHSGLEPLALRRSVLRRYSESVVAQKYIKLFESLL